MPSFDAVYPRLVSAEIVSRTQPPLWSKASATVSKHKSTQSVMGSLTNGFQPYDGDELSYRQTFLEIEFGTIDAATHARLKVFYGDRTTSSYVEGRNYRLEDFLGPLAETMANRLGRDLLSAANQTSVAPPKTLVPWNISDGFHDCRATAYAFLRNERDAYEEMNTHNHLTGEFDPRFYETVVASTPQAPKAAADWMDKARFGDIVVIGGSLHVATLVERGIVFDKDTSGASPFRFFFLQDTLDHYKGKMGAQFQYRVLRPRLKVWPRPADMGVRAHKMPRFGLIHLAPNSFGYLRGADGTLGLKMPGVAKVSQAVEKTQLADVPEHLHGQDLAEAQASGYSAGCAKDKFCVNDSATQRFVLRTLVRLATEIDPLLKEAQDPGQPAPSSLPADVAGDVAFVARHGIFSAPSPFDPDAPLARGEFQVSLSRLLDVLVKKGSLSRVFYPTPFSQDFPDLVAHPQRKTILSMAQFCGTAALPGNAPMGMLEFKPADAISRGDMVAAAMRFRACTALSRSTEFESALSIPYLP